MTAISNLKRASILEQTLDEAFPVVDPGTKPLGSLVLVQLKAAATRTKSGLVLTQGAIETEADNTRVAKVIAVGPLAYKNRETGANWPEGAWANPGDYVRISLYGGDRWRVHYDTHVTRDRSGQKQAETKLFAEFALIDDLALKGLIEDPMSQVAFL